MGTEKPTKTEEKPAPPVGVAAVTSAGDDEEFEEFPQQPWQQDADYDRKAGPIWEDNWDEDNQEQVILLSGPVLEKDEVQEFHKQLKEQLAKLGHKIN